MKDMADQFDVVVVGAGPAGYVAAIRCAQLGLQTACVDDWSNAQGKPSLGGTCLNVGCIPSKALLDSSERFAEAQHGLADHGISTGKVSVDIAKMLARKDQVVSNLTQGIAGLMKANKITMVHGRGRLLDKRQVEISHKGKVTQTLTGKHVILAVGSVPINIPVAAIDGDLIVDNAGALSFTSVPKRLGVIGAGVIGLELGSVWNRLGSNVTILEAMDTFLPPVDVQLSREVFRTFTKEQGLDIKLGAKVTASKVSKKGVQVSYTLKGEEFNETFDKLIVAVGRKPNTADIADKGVGLELDERGRIAINAQFETNIANVYAIGDAVKGPMLAHKGSEEGGAVAEIIAGQKPQLNHNNIPWVIYTHPEIAWVGMNEDEAKAAGYKVNSGFFPFAANGRALAMNAKGGRIKIVADAKTDRILGVHILGPSASELIAEAVLALEYSASSEDLARTVHAHPTLAETMHEAALAVTGRAIHKIN